MKEQNTKNKVFISNLIFIFSYCVLFISLFMGDINIELDKLCKYLRYISYALMIVQLLLVKWKKKDLIIFFLFLLMGVSYGLLTKDFYWTVVVLLINNIRVSKIDDNRLLDVHIFLTVLGMVCVLLCCLTGLLPDVLHARGGAEYKAIRHSFGFIHSNVLPLVVLYLMIYYVLRYRENVNLFLITGMFIAEIVLHFLSDSRNAFYLSTLLYTLVVIFRKISLRKAYICVINRVSNFFVLAISFFSLFMMIMLQFGGVFDEIDSFFSGRFRVAIFKMRIVGLHLLSFQSNENYFKDGIILDNGYLYIALRYGILLLLFYIVINILLSHKAKMDIYMLLCIMIAFMANMIDNDLTDYSFLPFILLAFNQKIKLPKLKK